MFYRRSTLHNQIYKRRHEKVFWKNCKRVTLWLVVLVLLVGGAAMVYMPIRAWIKLGALPPVITSIHYLGKDVRLAKEISGSTIYPEQGAFQKLVPEATRTWLTLWDARYNRHFGQTRDGINVYLEVKDRPTLYAQKIKPPSAYTFCGQPADIRPVSEGKVEIAWHKVSDGYRAGWIFCMLLGLVIFLFGLVVYRYWTSFYLQFRA